MKLIQNIATFLLTLSCVAPLSAQSDSYRLEVGDFSELKVSDGINVRYICSPDSAGMAYFSCPKNVAGMLMFSNNKNRLNIQLATEGETLERVPEITVCSMTLQKAENLGDSTLFIAGLNPVRDFKAEVIGNGSLIVNGLKAHKADIAIKTGNGHIVVNGRTQRAGLKNVGTGTLEASGLKADDVKCNVLGTGTIDCNASTVLTIVGAGSGKVYYGGTPEKITNRSIGIKAYSMDSKQVVE